MIQIRLRLGLGQSRLPLGEPAPTRVAGQSEGCQTNHPSTAAAASIAGLGRRPNGDGVPLQGPSASPICWQTKVLFYSGPLATGPRLRQGRGRPGRRLLDLLLRQYWRVTRMQQGMPRCLGERVSMAVGSWTAESELLNLFAPLQGGPDAMLVIPRDRRDPGSHRKKLQRHSQASSPPKSK